MKTLLIALLIIFPNIAMAENVTSNPIKSESDKTIHVLINPESVISENKKIIINKVIMSEEVIQIENQNYFEGWQGTLNHIIYSDNSLIKITYTDEKKPNLIQINLKNEVGKTDGFTKYATDEKKMLKSEITIYNFQNLNDQEFEKILYHEFGHGLGLVHSKDIRDIMYPILENSIPGISNDDLTALNTLYN